MAWTSHRAAQWSGMARVVGPNGVPLVLGGFTMSSENRSECEKLRKRRRRRSFRKLTRLNSFSAPGFCSGDAAANFHDPQGMISGHIMVS